MVGITSYQEGIVQRAVSQVSKHGQWINGPEVGAFERSMAAYVGVGHAIGCNSGTDALVLALRALRIGPGDNVIVPAFTFQATAAAVKLVGANPVFADIHEDGFGIDVSTIKIKAKAMIVVDMFGIPAKWFDIWDYAEDNSIPVIEDAAQAMGSEFYGIMPCGSLGKISCTSFYPSKPLAGIGDGGMVFTDDPKIAEDVRTIANHGRMKEPFNAVVPGMNSRLDSIQAAVLSQRLESFEIELEHRKNQAMFYNSDQEHNALAWFPSLYNSRRDRDADLKEYGPYGAKIIYPVPLNRMPAFAAHGCSCPVAESVCERILALPIRHHWETNECIEYIKSKEKRNEVQSA